MLLAYLPLYFVALPCLLFVSTLSYPHFNPVRMDISFLGVPRDNPGGWIVWSFAMMLQGIAPLPAVMRVSRRMFASGGHLGVFGSYTLLVSSIGMTFLGAIPQFAGTDALHIASGVLAMGGGYLGLLAWARPLLSSRDVVKPLRPLFVLLALLGPVGFLSTQGCRVLAGGLAAYNLYDPACPWFLSFSLWEWILYAGVSFAFVSMLGLSPSADGGGENGEKAGRFISIASVTLKVCAAVPVIFAAVLLTRRFFG